MAKNKVKLRLDLEGGKNLDSEMDFAIGAKAIIKFDKVTGAEFSLSYDTPNEFKFTISGKCRLLKSPGIKLDVSGKIDTDFDGSFKFKGKAQFTFNKKIKVTLNPIYDTSKGSKIVAGFEMVF